MENALWTGEDTELARDRSLIMQGMYHLGLKELADAYERRLIRRLEEDPGALRRLRGSTLGLD